MILFKKFGILILFAAIFCSCSKETPKEKAKRYLGYMDTFYFSLTDSQEKKAEEIIDIYFREKTKSSALNVKIYNLVKKHLDEGFKELDIEQIEQLIQAKRKMDSKIAPVLLKEANILYKMLSKEQKKELLESLEDLKKKSNSFNFWLGNSDA